MTITCLPVPEPIPQPGEILLWNREKVPESGYPSVHSQRDPSYFNFIKDRKKEISGVELSPDKDEMYIFKFRQSAGVNSSSVESIHKPVYSFKNYWLGARPTYKEMSETGS